MSNDITLFYIVMYIVFLLLPLIPAIALYKLFPNSQTTAEGEVSMVKFKAGGAFAAYVVTVAIGYTLIPLIRDAVSDTQGETTWTLKANLQLRDNNNNPVNYNALLEKVKVSIAPDIITNTNGHLIIKIPGGDGKTWSHPNMTLEAPNFGMQTIDISTLSKDDVELDTKNHILRIIKPIIIKEQDDYNKPYDPGNDYVNL